ncbi:MAG: MBL fold metallo-hydrolase [Deltaproteobacteria bacterium]|nr:MBL fold metallo-hydrolase [Deltaproteobacteria bacterium]
MKIKWYGHAAFLITSEKGTKIILDPYEPGAFGGQLSYGKINDQADMVLTSHDHADHNDTKSLPGSPQVVKGSGSKTIKGVSIKGISTYHDSSKGSERGANTIFNLQVDGIQVCHLGDLGHLLSDKEVAEIGPVDVLLIPVGGFFTIDAKEATRVAEQIKPKVLIPMHFKTGKCGFSIAPVEDFIKGKPAPKQIGSSETTFDKASLSQKMEIVILEHAL